MGREKKVILIACAAILGVVMFAVCVLIVSAPNTEPPVAPPQQIQGEEGIDWEDCINNERDCIFGRRRIDPTTATKKTPAPVSTTKKPTVTRTRGR